MSKHTPGPWLSNPCGLSGDFGIYPDTEPEFKIATLGYSGDSSETQANARLIAAAPDLLQALKDVLGIVRSVHEVPPTRATAAEAAIAKAEGNQPQTTAEAYEILQRESNP